MRANDLAAHYDPLRQWLDSLLAWLDRHPPIEHQRDDLFGVMLLTLLNKQRIHATSIRTLRTSPDTQIIARTMIETMYKLQWTALDADERARQWSEYA